MSGPISHDQARRFYDRIGRAQDARPPGERRALAALAEQGDFEHARAVVEFGCGTGRFAARLLRERLPADATYLALDASPRMAQLASAALAGLPGAHVKLTDGDIRFPVADGSADRVVSTYVLDLLSGEDIATFILEARRVLRPGGALAVASMTPGRTPSARVFTGVWQSLWRLEPSLLGGCRPLSLSGLLDPAEWTVIACFPVTDWLLSSEVLVARRR